MIQKSKIFFTTYRTELLFYFGFLTLLGMLFFLQSLYAEPNYDSTAPSWELIVNVFIDRLTAAYIWFLFTPCIIIIAQWLHTKLTNWFVLISVHILVGISFVVIHIIIYTFYIYFAHQSLPWMYAFLSEMKELNIGSYIWINLQKLNHIYRILYYCIIIAIHFAFEYFRRYNERELRASHLEFQLKETQLNTLQKQLQPHFLFNTLNSISSLMYISVDEADKMLTSLGDMLRISLERMNVQEIRLQEDIVFLERYLHIEQTRLGSRLQLETEFSPETLNALVPTMITQPLVENAIRHGISPKKEPSHLSIRSTRNENRLVIVIEDDGLGFSGSDTFQPSTGLGIKNTFQRLTLLYGNNYSLLFDSKQSGGVRVTLSIPFRIQSV